MKNELLAAVNRSMLSSEADPIPHIIGEMCSCKEMLELGWRVEEEFGQIWIGVAHQQAVRRLQGWKLHVSAAIPCAESVLRQALAVLLAEPTRFKVASSLSRLADLNQGRAGLSQIGKFITIYPSDDEQCIRLAVRLDEVTRGLRGPAIPSDLALRPGSLIYYRYGSFSEQLIADREGRPRAVIATSPGELIEDRRALTYHEPVGVKNPFLTAGFAGASTSHPILLQDRFLPIAPLHQSAQSIIYEAVDLQLARRCVLKRARRDALLDRYHRDAHDILRHEAHILSRLETVLSVPKTYALFKQDDDLWLAMDYIEGTLLKDYIKNQSHKAEHLPLGLLISWARELAFMLDKLHQAGIIYRDLKSANIIVTPDSFLRLIDFGISYDLASSDPQFYGGTRGYSSPQQNTNEPASIADDIYSFGALLYLLATGVEPAEAPHEVALLKRPLTVLNPNLPDTLCQIISRCLAPRPQDRFTCMQKIVAELQMVQDSSPISIIHTLDKVPANELDSYYSYACELGETLQVVVQTARRGQGPLWAQLKPAPGSKIILRNLSQGMAGVLLTLAEFVTQQNTSSLRSTLRDGAYWLMQSERLGGPILPGLYSGEAGVGIALLRAGQLLEDQVLISAAEKQGQLIATCPYDLPDLMHGTAGRLKYHIWLWQATARSYHLQAALQAGCTLLEQAEDIEDGGMGWKISAGYYGAAGENVYLGYAHGMAGIADALLDLYQASGQIRFLKAVQRVGGWLLRRARPMGHEQQGVGWERNVGGDLNAAFWCHGSAGIASFLLHAAQQKVLPSAIEIACKAGKAVAEGTRWAGPSRCHGLSGNIELFLDLYKLTGNEEWLQAACTFARILEAYATEEDGMRLWLSDEGPAMISPGFLLGYAGIAATLLRLGSLNKSLEASISRLF